MLTLAEAKNKGWPAISGHPGVSVTTVLPRLRQVVAQRGEPHVLDPLRGDGGRSGQAGVRRQAITYPRCPNQVRVLHSHLQPALGTVVGLVPEPRGAFDNGPKGRLQMGMQ